MGENLRIDHVILGTADIDSVAARLELEYGLGSVIGGRHEGRGTGNRIVPLGSAYLELMSVVDPVEAAAHPFGRWFMDQIDDGDRFLMWCVGTDDIDAVARRLKLEVEEWTRVTPDGTTLTWRLAGLETSNAHPEVPFFIEWTVPDELHPSRARAEHDVWPLGFEEIAIAGDTGWVAEWLDGSELPIRFTTGARGVTGVTIATETGGIALP